MTGQESSHRAIADDSMQGKTFRPSSIEEAAEALELVFDYRGDVTLETRSGEKVTGYVYNREKKGGDSYLDIMPKDTIEKRRYFYRDVAAVAFSGKDMASGRSWEAWTAKWNEKKRALAEGRDIGNIEPKATHEIDDG